MATNTQRPLQKTSWSEKIAKNYEFFKLNMDYLIGRSNFGSEKSAGLRTENMQELYDVYNGKFPARWFTHVTDPFSAQNANHKKWPAKMRPANILSPNVNLLHGEYPGRPFKFTVAIRGDDGYNSFEESRKAELYKNLSQIFINTVNEVAGSDDPSAPADPDNPGINTGVDSKPAELPEELMNKFLSTFRDTLAIQAQTDLDLILEDQHIREKLTDMFKDWLIVGETYSFKDVIRDKTIYEAVSPLEIDYDKSPHVKYIEDGEWVVRRMEMTVSDIVDRFYDSLKPSEIDKMEKGNYASSPAFFADHLSSSRFGTSGKIPVYHVVWKSLKKMKVITYPDPVTGEMQEDIVDETYKINKELGESEEVYWVTQVLEGYRIGDDLYLEMKPVNYQPNQLHNLSAHKLPYNGRCFSNRHTENTSVLKIGLPFQILYVIIFFTLEKTIAKSRGKVMMIDSNVIPRGDGWDEEKFFWYSEAQGYMLVNRNQTGVDKSFNQYVVHDMGMFDHIAELIKLLEYCKQSYNDQLGISRQRQGDVKATDTATGTDAAVSQSAVITEMIFTGFDQFVRTELDGLLNCSQIANINGKKALYTGSDQRTAILNINPDRYCYADMGIMMADSAQERAQLARFRQYSQALVQNGMDPDAVLAVETANNVSQLKGILKEVQAKQQKLAEQNAKTEHEQEIARIELEKQYDEYLSLLDIQKMHEEYDRKDDMIITQGNINMAIEAGKAGTEGGGADFMAFAQQRDAAAEDSRLKEKEIDRKQQADRAKQELETKKIQAKYKEIEMKKQIAKSQAAIKRKAATK